MILFTLCFIVSLFSANGLASCGQNSRLAVYTEEISRYGLKYTKTFVNKSVPVGLVFYVEAENTDIESVTWKRDNEPIVIEDSVNKEIYYSVKHADRGDMIVTLHIVAPTARVTGNWTMNLRTADAKEHVATCFIEAQPIIRPLSGAVRGREGYPLSVSCEIETSPPPTLITWQKVVEDPNRPGEPKSVPLVNATFKSENGIEDALMEWTDATQVDGLYMCMAHSPLGVDHLLFEVRVKGLKTILWPCIGIGLEILVLFFTILLYERAQSKRRKQAEEKSVVPNPAS